MGIVKTVGIRTFSGTEKQYDAEAAEFICFFCLFVPINYPGR